MHGIEAERRLGQTLKSLGFRVRRLDRVNQRPSEVDRPNDRTKDTEPADGLLTDELGILSRIDRHGANSAIPSVGTPSMTVTQSRRCGAVVPHTEQTLSAWSRYSLKAMEAAY
jgi:hypothetical protein